MVNMMTGYLLWLYLTGIQLRSYQLDGVRWLTQCLKHQEGCILGDEMGLGKTCQVSSYPATSVCKLQKSFLAKISYFTG